MCAIVCIYRGEDMQDGVNVPALGGRIPDRDRDTHTSVVPEGESETHAHTQIHQHPVTTYTLTNREVHQVAETYTAETEKTIHRPVK